MRKVASSSYIGEVIFVHHKFQLIRFLKQNGYIGSYSGVKLTDGVKWLKMAFENSLVTVYTNPC
ncbi:hypothetical protein [Clostridium magnum]|uniref:hypothetical protein n=1 Tax=Clostridium magnum TaxID=33954 RepID=UPI00082E9A5D|nr:hypothetical protein [Clostridium magnum]